jgi:hypothetical protein
MTPNVFVDSWDHNGLVLLSVAQQCPSLPIVCMVASQPFLLRPIQPCHLIPQDGIRVHGGSRWALITSASSVSLVCSMANHDSEKGVCSTREDAYKEVYSKRWGPHERFQSIFFMNFCTNCEQCYQKSRKGLASSEKDRVPVC